MSSVKHSRALFGLFLQFHLGQTLGESVHVSQVSINDLRPSLLFPRGQHTRDEKLEEMNPVCKPKSQISLSWRTECVFLAMSQLQRISKVLFLPLKLLSSLKILQS